MPNGLPIEHGQPLQWFGERQNVFLVSIHDAS